MVFVECRCARRLGRERVEVLLRSMLGGREAGRVVKVSTIQAMRSRTQRTEPAREFITSELISQMPILSWEELRTWIFKW